MLEGGRTVHRSFTSVSTPQPHVHAEIYQSLGNNEKAADYKNELEQQRQRHQKMVTSITSHPLWLQSVREVRTRTQAQEQMNTQKLERQVAEVSLALSHRERLLTRIEQSIRTTLELHAKGDTEGTKLQLQQIYNKLQQNRSKQDSIVSAQKLAENEHLSRIKATFPRLTPTLTQLAAYIATGSTTAEIAQLMHVTPQTVATQRKRLRKRLEITSQVDLRGFLRKSIDVVDLP